jgi:hypothetical protein
MGYVLIPVAGPWIAAGYSKDGAGVLALVGIVQLTGAALTVGGIVRYISDGRAAETSAAVPASYSTRPPSRTSLSFGVLPTRDGAFGFLSGRM